MVIFHGYVNVYQRVTSYGYIEYRVLTRNHVCFSNGFLRLKASVFSGAPPFHHVKRSLDSGLAVLPSQVSRAELRV